LLGRGRAGVIVGTGLRHAQFGGQAAPQAFGDAEDVVFAGGGKGLFFAAGSIRLPLEDPRLVEVVEKLGGEHHVAVELQAEHIGIVVVQGLAGGNVEGRVRYQPAGINMMAVPAAAGRGVKRLRAFLRAGAGRENGLGVLSEQPLPLQFRHDGLGVTFGQQRGRVLHDVQYGGAQAGVADFRGGVLKVFPRGHDVLGSVRHFPGRHVDACVKGDGFRGGVGCGRVQEGFPGEQHGSGSQPAQQEGAATVIGIHGGSPC